jgi:hypothetical protein
MDLTREQARCNVLAIPGEAVDLSRPKVAS